jgi:murein DD-endopeptidase MepM/ murein hydrolase activator NlpD
LEARAKQGHEAGTQRQGGRPTTLVAIASTTAILCATAGAASAQEPSQPTPGGGVTAASSGGSGVGGGSGSGAGSGSSELRLKSESTGPGKVFFNGTRKATYQYSIAGRRPKDLKIQAVRRRDGRVVRTWRRDNVEPRTKQTIRWAGNNQQGGETRRGKYVFRVRKPSGGAAERSRAKAGARSIRLLPHKFPVRGRHSYWDGFGAGRRHMGQDIGGKCGSKVVAARGGKVQWRGYQAGGAGYYLVIDGTATGQDYVYMHLNRRHRPKEGRRVRTGQRIGSLGGSGNATDCLLHFELWSRSGWYEGGRAMRSVRRQLKRWDAWS